MKKKIYLISTTLLAMAALFLSSCLKDPRYVDFSKAGNVVDFPLGGTSHFGADAITEAPDTDANGTIVRQFAVNVATATKTTTATKITLAIDNSIVDSYNALGGPVTYEVMPTDAYAFTTTDVTIPAGQSSANVSVTFYKNKLDPSKSYMLPIKIASTSGGYTISGNMSIHYYHFIGNDFAGVYHHYYTRWSVPDTTGSLATADAGGPQDKGDAIFNPVGPTEFTVQTFYYTGPNYDVTFTKTGTGPTATYSNFAIQFLPSDVAAGTQWATNITVVNQPIFLPADYHTNPFDPNKQYTYTQALSLFRFYFTTASRAIIDTYIKE